MAVTLDFADNQDKNKDIILVRSDKYRAYNLLKDNGVFADNPGIGLDIAGMVSAGIDDDQIEALITQYLVDFGCNLQNTQIISRKGNISLKYNFGGNYVQS